MNEKLDKEGMTFQDYYQNNRKLRLLDVSGLLNGYLAVFALTISPLFIDLLPMGARTIAPLEFFFNVFFPIGALIFLWGVKLALKTKEWQMISSNLVKLAIPFLFAIISQWFLENAISPESIWWLSFLL